jgi:acylphosphatase
MPEAAFRVIGRVQGVGFRWWTRTQAIRLGVVGSVRNAADGSVEVVARGDGASLAELRRQIAAGPAGAHVERVEEIEVPHSPADGFVIVH